MLYTASVAGSIYIGTAGWTVPREHAAAFPFEGSGLTRYASVLNAVEINSTFRRRHRLSTFERWRESVPENFRFSVKMPRAITHEGELKNQGGALSEFLTDAGVLGDRLGPLLVQLPPALSFDRRLAAGFFSALRERYAGQVVCEPRHASWFDADADALLASFGVARAIADPARPPGAELEGGSRSLVYLRLHGSPRRYYSAYGLERVAGFAAQIRLAAASAASVWCIFDNTASGAAAGDVLQLRNHLASG